ncbi:hypothetical protein FEF65_09135 [Mariprofundus erugo]|uniref:ABC transporter substrate-binding protein n=1 Tax=Mariprofundus erugo TaxID=2528639 RepID=A0A5R9GLW2_9PROT|nr:ABC transporter substrate binding protein [Mariprofundus erugo]TLS66678.1 hypothetical protein FEF65_09135 [Mariprofundus erugo]
MIGYAANIVTTYGRQRPLFRRLAASVVALVSLLIPLSAPHAATCLYISSYHSGYEWNDGIEQGLEKSLAGKCRLEKFYMDSKRHQSDDHSKMMALQAKAYIEKLSPDILIAADDNASRYLIQPFYKNSSIPVVFCGINYSVAPYGYPYDNATGMIEISPVRPLYKQIKAILGSVKRGAFLAADVTTQHREYDLNKEVYSSHGIELAPVFVKTMAEWSKQFKRLQSQGDFLVIGNNAGISDWSEEQATAVSRAETRILTVTNYDWMRWYALLSITKLAEEQGEWAGDVALAVLGGADISKIPVVANRHWNIYVNPELLETSGIKLPQTIMLKAIRVSR